MPRPKKDSVEPSARERIIESFWELLEDHQISEITVGNIAHHAQCNRGSFYYHFSDIDSFMEEVVRSELYEENAIPKIIFNYLILDTWSSLESSPEVNLRFYRLSLLLDRGGESFASTYIKKVIVDLWKSVLCPDGSEIKQEARILIEYAVSGIFGLLLYWSKQGTEVSFVEILGEGYLKDIASFMYPSIIQAQGLTQAEVVKRITTL